VGLRKSGVIRVGPVPGQIDWTTGPLTVITGSNATRKELYCIELPAEDGLK
jgi:hypothetical protein